MRPSISAFYIGIGIKRRTIPNKYRSEREHEVHALDVTRLMAAHIMKLIVAEVRDIDDALLLL